MCHNLIVDVADQRHEQKKINDNFLLLLIR